MCLLTGRQKTELNTTLKMRLRFAYPCLSVDGTLWHPVIVLCITVEIVCVMSAFIWLLHGYVFNYLLLIITF